MNHPWAATSAANDNGDPFATPEGAYLQLRRARRRHLAHDTATMAPERLFAWRVVLAGLDEAERGLLPHLRARPSPLATTRVSVPPRGRLSGALAGLVLVARRLRARAGRWRG
jgi:hypothetical protein